MTREGLKIHLAANYADTMPDYVDGNYVRGLEEGYKKGWDDADAHQPNPWRDAKKDPPQVGVEVLCETNKGNRFLDKRVEENGEKRWRCSEDDICGFCDDEEIIYWMPIPSSKGCEV